MHGEGSIRYADGQKYSGLFLNGKPAPEADPAKTAALNGNAEDEEVPDWLLQPEDEGYRQR